jgi:hypothetical protein
MIWSDRYLDDDRLRRLPEEGLYQRVQEAKRRMDRLQHGGRLLLELLWSGVENDDERDTLASALTAIETGLGRWMLHHELLEREATRRETKAHEAWMRQQGMELRRARVVHPDVFSDAVQRVADYLGRHKSEDLSADVAEKVRQSEKEDAREIVQLLLERGWTSEALPEEREQ